MEYNSRQPLRAVLVRVVRIVRIGWTEIAKQKPLRGGSLRASLALSNRIAR